ncbi:MAG: hypothetical protein JO010_03875 [Alphaproteobacteria bacterium]|nr:hypothetical protein [Alphaproteobacteria bacterium]
MRPRERQALDPPAARAEEIAALVLGNGVPLAFHALSRRSGGSAGRLSLLGSLAILAGGLLMRHAILHAGNASAQRPGDYFRAAQPRDAATGRRR